MSHRLYFKGRDGTEVSISTKNGGVCVGSAPGTLFINGVKGRQDDKIPHIVNLTDDGAHVCSVSFTDKTEARDFCQALNKPRTE